MDDLFSVDDLMEMRALETAAMPSQCTIQREVRAREDGGFEVVTWANVATDVPCRLSAGVSGNELMEAGQTQTLGRWILSLPAETVIEKGNQVIVTGTSVEGVPWTRTLNVVAPVDPRTYSVRLKVICSDQSASGR